MNAECPRYSAMLKEAYAGEEAQQYQKDNEVTFLNVYLVHEFYQISNFTQRMLLLSYVWILGFFKHGEGEIWTGIICFSI